MIRRFIIGPGKSSQVLQPQKVNSWIYFRWTLVEEVNRCYSSRAEPIRSAVSILYFFRSFRLIPLLLLLFCFCFNGISNLEYFFKWSINVRIRKKISLLSLCDFYSHYEQIIYILILLVTSPKLYISCRCI